MIQTLDVLILVFDTDPDLLRRCIDSVRSQRDQDGSVRICVQDNSSNDRLRAEFSSLVDSWEESVNVGFARGANSLVEKSRAHGVLLLNPDARLESGALAEILRCLNSAGNDALYCGWLVNRGQVQVDAYLLWFYSSSRILRRKRYRKMLDDHRNEGLVPVDKVSGGGLFAKRDLLDEYGPFDESFFLYGEDADLSFRARAAGLSLLALPSAVIEHQAASSQATHSALVEMARCDAAMRLLALHKSYPLAVLGRLELAIITIVGATTPKLTSSTKGLARLSRLQELRRWGLRRTVLPFSPLSLGKVDRASK